MRHGFGGPGSRIIQVASGYKRNGCFSAWGDRPMAGLTGGDIARRSSSSSTRADAPESSPVTPYTARLVWALLLSAIVDADGTLVDPDPRWRGHRTSGA